MNHNELGASHGPSDVRPAPRHRAEPLTDVLDGHQHPALHEQTYVAEVVAGAPTPEVGNQIAEAYARHGNAFALYLALAADDRRLRGDAPGHGLGPDAAEPLTIEADFVNSYHGSYSSRDALIDNTIETLGWQQELDWLLHSQPQLRAAVTIDRDAVYAFASHHLEILRAGDELHVFEAWS